MALVFRISRPRDRAAFTRIELAVVLAALLLLTLIALPLLANGSRSDQASCLNNLRQIGIAFQAWGNDHDDRRPWSVPMSEGGSAGHVLRNNAYFHYAFLSNHLSPAVLMDPAEIAPNKRRAENWSASPDGGFLHVVFRNNAVSYMFSLHTSRAEANNILATDRYVQFRGAGICPVGGGTTIERLGTGPFFSGWTNGVHGIAGNVLGNDGHVEYASQDRLRAIVFRPDDISGDDHMVTPF
jgi:hypothetical protein